MNARDEMIGHLEKFSKEELIDLIMKNAYPQYIENFNSQFATKEEALLIFQDVYQSIVDLFSDDGLLYDPYAFANELFGELKRIEGIWSKVPTKIGDLIIKIIMDIETLFDRGYLYIENYGEEDEYFESEHINIYIYNFAKSLSEPSKSRYVRRLLDLLGIAGYATFDGLEEKLKTIAVK